MWWLSKPSNWFAFVLVLGILLWLIRQRRVSNWLIGLGAAGLIAGGLTPLSVWLIGPLERRFAAPPDVTQVHGIVVLAGAERIALTTAHGQPQVNDLSGRLFAFMRLAHAHPEAILLHSGAGTTRPNELGPNQSDIAAQLLLESGLDSKRLTLEDRSRNTCESAAMSFELVQPKPDERWLLVTSAYHMPRAIGCFRAIDWEVIPYPTDYHSLSPASLFLADIEFAENLRRLDLATHEWAALAYYRLGKRIDSIFPGPE